jgi:hypothetical protein
MTQKISLGLLGLKLAENIFKRLTEDGYTTEKLTQEWEDMDIIEALKASLKVKGKPSTSGCFC